MGRLLQIPSVGRELARIAVDRAVAESQALGVKTCIAVVDAAGLLVAYDRMDGSPLHSAQHARDKAAASAGNGSSTYDTWKYVADDPQLRLGVLKVKDVSILGGGVPVVLDGVLIGAIGVSGTGGMPEDHAIATAAAGAVLAAIGEETAAD